MTDIVHPSLLDTTAANNTAARGNSVAEGWLPSVVNNWGRAFMSLLGGLYDDLSGQNTVGGTANAITVTGNIPLTALAEGVIVAFQNTGGPNTAAVTLAVDGLTAKAIRMPGDFALVGGELVDDGIYLVRYDASANGAAGAWIVLNPSPTYLVSADAGASGPVKTFYHNSASPAVNDIIASIIFQGNDSGGNLTNYFLLRAVIEDATNSSEDGSLQFLGMAAGSAATNFLTLSATSRYRTGSTTPTLFNTTNVAASTPDVMWWAQIGDIIVGGGQLDVDPTTTATATTLGISVPITSTFSIATDAWGTASALGFVESWGIRADVANARLVMQGIVGTNANHTVVYQFGYKIK